VKFNFFMLQADVLPNMGFSATRKRLIQAYNCTAADEDIVEGKPAEHDESSGVSAEEL
jgi:hypothetical protein